MIRVISEITVQVALDTGDCCTVILFTFSRDDGKMTDVICILNRNFSDRNIVKVH